MKPRKRIARTGRKAARERPALDAFRDALLTRAHGMCEVQMPYRLRTCGQIRPHDGAHPHHIFPEDRDRGLHDPARGLFLCPTAHRWAHDHPAAAAEAGLLRPSAPE